ALACDRQCRAGVDGIAVDDDGAGATARAVAYPLGPGDLQAIAEGVEQGAARLDLDRLILAVDLEGDVDFAGDDLGALLLGELGLGLFVGGRRVSAQDGAGRGQARPAEEVAPVVPPVLGFVFGHRIVTPWMPERKDAVGGPLGPVRQTPNTIAG